MLVNKFYRSRLLLRGLSVFSAIRGIVALAQIRDARTSDDFLIYYRKFGFKRQARVRGRHLRSDMQSVLELAAGDCYHLAKVNWEPDVVIDGGGNSGLFSLAASARWPASQVKCFEPMPENVRLIAEQLKSNGLVNQVELVPAALGNRPRVAQFFVRDANQGSLDASIGFSETISVPVARLWDVYEGIRDRRVFIKLDVEGAEFEILSDFFQQVPLRQLVIVAEVHGDHKKQDTLMREARAAGMVGRYWEQASETAHVVLASSDVGIPMFSEPGL
jgi:FkbM family methyltransferase